MCFATTGCVRGFNDGGALARAVVTVISFSYSVMLSDSSVSSVSSLCCSDRCSQISVHIYPTFVRGFHTSFLSVCKCTIY